MLTVIAEICVKPGRRTAVLQAIENVTPTVLEEAGCGSYQALTDYKAQVPGSSIRPIPSLWSSTGILCAIWSSISRLPIWNSTAPTSKPM